MRIGILGVAHMHVWSYVALLKDHPEVELIGAFDEIADRLNEFADKAAVEAYLDSAILLDKVDAVVIASENTHHARLAQLAGDKGKHILCEKPLVTNQADAKIFQEIAKKVKVMTAFPCRFAPAFQRLKERIAGGEIGAIKGICATNRGSCPFDWFVQTELSGGGAMIDHTVHVTDLLRDLLGEDPVRVQAMTGSNMYGENWEDTAMLTLEFPSGIFATLDSSWSRPSSYKTWGDVMMTVVGETGVIEMDMFGQSVNMYSNATNRYGLAGYGSNADKGLVDAFVRCLIDDLPTPVSAHDGIAAARVAIAGYESARIGDVVAIAS